MKINEELSNLLYAFGIYQEDEISSCNMYLGRLYELTFELEDAKNGSNTIYITFEDS